VKLRGKIVIKGSTKEIKNQNNKDQIEKHNILQIKIKY